MAIALGAQAGNATPSTTATTHTATLTLSTGDLAIVLVSSRDGGNTIDSVVGDVNGAYTRVGTDQYDTSGNGRVSCWRFENCASGSEIVTVTFSATSRAAVNFSRWTGAATASALDQTNAQNNASGTAHNCGSITTTGAGLIVTVYAFGGDEGATTQTGFTALTAAAGGYARENWGYKIIASSESNTGSLTSTNSLASAAKIASFNESGGGGGSTPKAKRRSLMGVG